MISPALTVLTQRTPRRRVLTLLCSLLNTALHPPNLSPLPISSMPYNHLVTRAMDADAMPESAISALCILLDYQSGEARDRVIGGANAGVEVGEEAERLPTSKSNAFRYSLAKLVRLFISLKRKKSHRLRFSTALAILSLSSMVFLRYWSKI